MPPKSGVSGLGGLAGAFQKSNKQSASRSNSNSTPTPTSNSPSNPSSSSNTNPDSRSNSDSSPSPTSSSNPRPRRTSASSSVSAASTATAVTSRSTASAATVTGPPSDLDASVVVAGCLPGASAEATRKSFSSLGLWIARVNAGADHTVGERSLQTKLLTLDMAQRTAVLIRVCSILSPVLPSAAYRILTGNKLFDIMLTTSVSQQADALALICATCEPMQARAPKDLTPGTATVSLPPLVGLALRAPDLQTAVRQALDRSGPVWTLLQTSLDAGLPSETNEDIQEQTRRLLLALKVRGRVLRILIQWAQASEGPRVPLPPGSHGIRDERPSDLLRGTLRAHEAEALDWCEKYMRIIVERKQSILRGGEDAWVGPIPILLEVLATELGVSILSVRTKDQVVQAPDAPLPPFLELMSYFVAPKTNPPEQPPMYLPGFVSGQGTRSSLHVDRALHFLLASIMQALPSYPPPPGSEEEQQVDRLRKLAVSDVREGDDATMDREVRTEMAYERVSKLIHSGATRLVSALMFPRRGTGGGTGSIHASATVRSLLATIVDDLTRPTIKSLRTELIAQGIHSVAFGLSTASFRLPGMPPFPKEEEPEPGTWTHAARAVARFSITSDPKVLWPEDRRYGMLVMIVALWRGGADPIPTGSPLARTSTAGSERLDKFEATLALTNYAAIDNTWAARVANQPGLDASTEGEYVKLREALLQRLLGEDSPQLRRAYVELMVNLTEDLETSAFLAGGVECMQSFDADFKAGRELAPPLTSVKQWVHMTFALCAPQGQSEESDETGLPTRLAASALLAYTLQWPTVKHAAYSLPPSTFGLLAKCVHRPMKDGPNEANPREGTSTALELVGRREESVGWTGEEQDLDEEDMHSDPQGPDHARAELAVRALAAVRYLVEHAQQCPAGRTREQMVELLDRSQTGVEVKRLATVAHKLAAGSWALDATKPAAAETRAMWDQLSQEAALTCQILEGDLGLDCARKI